MTNPFVGDDLRAQNPFSGDVLKPPVRKAKTPAQLDRLRQNAAELNAADRATDRAELLQSIAGTFAAPLSQVPGGRALQAAVAGRGDYRRGLEQVDAAIASAPAATRIPAKILGGTTAMLAMPGSAVMQGARYGVMSGLLNADPDANVSERLKDAAIGGTVGAVAGKAGEALSVGGRALLAPTPGAAQTALKAAAEKAAKPGYDAFRDLGDLGMTKDLRTILRLPVVRTALKTVRGESPELATLPSTHAKVLDAIYKRVGNKAFKAAHGFETGEARAALLDAIESAAQAKGGTYAAPVGIFREGMQKVGAVQRGRAAVQNAASTKGGAAGAPLASSPEAFARWAKSATPDELRAASVGILGQARRAGLFRRGHVLGTDIPLPWPSRELVAAPKLLASTKGSSKSATALRGLLSYALTPTP